MKPKFDGLKRIRLDRGYQNQGLNIGFADIEVPQVKRNTLMGELEDFQVEIEIENEPIKPEKLKTIENSKILTK